MTKSQKRIFLICSVLISEYLLIVALLGMGSFGVLIRNSFLYFFGLSYYWIVVWLFIYLPTTFLKKSIKRKIRKYWYSILLVMIGGDLLLNLILNSSKTLPVNIGEQFSFSSNNIDDTIGFIQALIITYTKQFVGQIGGGIAFSIISLIGIFLILDFDKALGYIFTKLFRIKKNNKKENKIKESKLEDNNFEELNKNLDKRNSKKKLSFFPEFRKKEQKTKISLTDSINDKNEIESNTSKPFTLNEELITGVTQSSKKEKSSFTSLADSSSFKLPTINLLDINEEEQGLKHQLKEQAKTKGQQLIESLKMYNLNVKIKHIFVGPSITKYELEPELGVKVNKFSSLAKDLAMAMAAKSVRIEAPIPGKSLIGVEIPNNTTGLIGFRKILDSSKNDWHDPLAVGLGEGITGEPVYLDIKSTPHMLIAGSTGSGKSVCVNTIILSILFKASPEDVKMLLIDPKKVELTPYNEIPHLIAPVVTDPEQAAVSLNKLVHEMERRYEIFSLKRVKNIKSYNEKVKNSDDEKKLPYIVTIIDELSDLMMVASSEVETAIARLAQMARAAGIHLIIATQRPSTDVITGLIKSNIPTRIAFMVSSSIDSRTILDKSGAEKLLGRGDMLLSRNGNTSFERIQGCFVSDEEIQKVVDFVEEQDFVEEDELREKFTNLEEEVAEEKETTEEDPLLGEAVEIAIHNNKISTSLLQRRLRIGYNRAANLIEAMEDKNYISKQDGNKPRKILIDKLPESE